MTSMRHRLSSQHGQAMTETLLITLPLVMLLAAVYQIFLADEHIFRLATASHARLFNEQAFPANHERESYAWRYVDWDGPDQYVPVVGFFRMAGLSREDMRIRSARGGLGGYKRIAIGAGTAPSLAGASTDNVYGYLANADRAITDLDLAALRSKLPN